MLFGVVLVAVALVGVVDVLTGVVLVAVALVDIVDVPGLVAVMLMSIALVDVMNVLASVVFVFVAFVRIVTGSNHINASTYIKLGPPRTTRLYQVHLVVKRY